MSNTTMSTPSKPCVRDVYFNAEHRRVMRMLMAAWEEEKDNEISKKNALWRVTDCEDVLWLCAVWVQYDEHDVVVDFNEANGEQKRKCEGKKHALVTNTAKFVKGYNYFLVNCTSLAEVNFSGMTSLRKIGNWFLYRCTSLVDIDFAGLHMIEEIGDAFLCECESLRNADFSGMTSLRKIGYGFLGGCASLVEVNFTGFTQVEEIGHFLLRDCASLRNADFSDMTSLRKIGDRFLQGCTRLVEVNFSGIDKLEEVWEDGFMLGCSSMKTVRCSSCHENLVCALSNRFENDVVTV